MTINFLPEILYIGAVKPTDVCTSHEEPVAFHREDKVARQLILLRAAFDLLLQAKSVSYILDTMSSTVFYDGAECDGSCLLEDIADELGLEL